VSRDRLAGDLFHFRQRIAEPQAAALEALLEQFRVAYNDRPHQGLALPGLSPNEFAVRFWLL
jgi:hypothetical protein